MTEQVLLPAEETDMATIFHPGVSHGHGPSGRWTDVQANPNSSLSLNLLCPRLSPRELVLAAKAAEFLNKPIALKHLDWYLIDGKGKEFNEDANIKLMLETDSGVQAAIAALVPRGRTSGTFTGFMKIEQADYQNQDLRFAFGAVDRLDFEVDFAAGTLHGWFQDFYEWHPFYPGLYTAFPDDGARETNCLHAALVELKSTGAADFWMKGEATVPLSVLGLGAPSSSGTWL
jgi:hypothetical protein